MIMTPAKASDLFSNDLTVPDYLDEVGGDSDRCWPFSQAEMSDIYLNRDSAKGHRLMASVKLESVTSYKV